MAKSWIWPGKQAAIRSGVETLRVDMPYRYLEDIAISDVAFEAWGETLEGLFVAAGDATMNVMVEDLDTVSDRERRTIRVEERAMDMLLFELLQALIFYKDAERLLLRLENVKIRHQGETYLLTTQAYGETLDPSRHELLVDVKAVTLHRFHVGRTSSGWEAKVILDT